MRTGMFRIALMLGALASVAFVPTPASTVVTPGSAGPRVDGVILFAGGGMRQDLLEEYAAAGLMPAMNGLLTRGLKTTEGGLLTQAPATTGAGWYSLATGTWAGVHGSTNNTFHVNGQPFGNRVNAFDAGVLEVETLAQATERAGKKVAQIEWAGGSVGTIDGPTVDGRTFHSGRGIVSNFISPNDLASAVSSFGLQFDHPAGFAGQPPFPGAAPVPAVGWINVPVSYSLAMEVRLRVLDFGVDKYGLDAYIYDSTDDAVVNYDRILLSRTKDGSDSAANLTQGEWADLKVKIVDGPLAGLTAGLLIKVEELTPDLSKARLFHSSVTRARAWWPGWPGEPGFVGDFGEYVAQEFPTSMTPDSAILQAGIVSEATYVEQGLYWETYIAPVIQYILARYQPALAMVGYPVTDDFTRRFLGLITPSLPSGAPNPAYDDAELDGTSDGRVVPREGFVQRAYEGADATLARVQALMPARTATFVSSDHGYGTQFLAVDASKLLVDLGLLSKPQTSNCRPASGETIGKAKACWAGGTVQIYLNLAGRDPAGGGYQQVTAVEEAATVAQIKAAFLGLVDPNDWTRDGMPEGWKVIDRAFTKAEARAVPNGASTTADMAHPTRTGDLVVFAYPPYQFEEALPGTLVALSRSFGQSGFAPDVRVPSANINMRAAFLAGGGGIALSPVPGLRTIDIAPTVAYLLRIPVPRHSRGKACILCLTGW